MLLSVVARPIQLRSMLSQFAVLKSPIRPVIGCDLKRLEVLPQYFARPTPASQPLFRHAAGDPAALGALQSQAASQ